MSKTKPAWLSLFALASVVTLGSGCHLIDALGLDDPGQYQGDEWPDDPRKPDEGPNCHRSEVPPPPPGPPLQKCPELGSRCGDATALWCFIDEGRVAVLRCDESGWNVVAVDGEVVCDDGPAPEPAPCGGRGERAPGCK